jgi:hypothetical protein
LRIGVLAAPMVMDGPMHGNAFRVYVEQVLVPELTPADLRRHGQPPATQGQRCSRGDRDRRCDPALPAAPSIAIRSRRESITAAINFAGYTLSRHDFFFGDLGQQQPLLLVHLS